LFSSVKNFEEIFKSSLLRSIKRIKRRLIYKTYYTNELKSRDESIMYNSSLEIGYCSTTLSNCDIIRLVRLVLKIRIDVVKQILSSMFNTFNQCPKIGEMGSWQHLI
jgi:hypothetical protein